MGRLGWGVMALAVALAAAAALAAWPAAGRGARQASPAAATPCPATSEAEAEALARRFVEERWTDPAVLDALLAEGVVAHRAVGTGTLGAAEAQQRAREFRTAFPDVRVSVGRVVVQGDAAAVAWVAEGTHRGEFDGVAATGRRAAWEGIAIVRVACGRIAEYWSASDGLGLRRQLGIVTDDELADVAAPAAQGATADASPAAACPATTAAANEELIRRYLAEVWGQGDIGAIDEVLAPGHVHHQPRGAVVQDPAALAASAREFRAAFPDFRTAVDEAIAAGDRVVVRWTRTGTHLGLFRGLAPTGRAVAWTGIWIARVACGRVAETWSEADVLGLYRQLGLAIDGAPATPAATAP